MAIVETRIDDRLIHGQVCSLWIPKYDVQRILIVDDEIAQNEMRKTALRFGCPERCKLSIFDSAKAAEKLGGHIDEGIRVMILVNSPVPLLKMAEHGYTVPFVSVGNMAGKPGARKVSQMAYATDEEWKAFEGLAQRGVQICVQELPNDAREDITADFK